MMAVRCVILTAVMTLPQHVSGTGGPCLEDPTHDIGDSWECDDKCNTCTCLPDGTVSATGRCCGDNCQEDIEPREALVVKLGLAFALLCFACFLGICYLMCCKGGNHKASELVRELEGEE